jgi:hypothetical protein
MKTMHYRLAKISGPALQTLPNHAPAPLFLGLLLLQDPSNYSNSKEQ